MIKNLIFIGYPGSGKGTVAKLMTQYDQISTGDLLRKEIASGSKLGREIATIINQGNLVSDEMALATIKSNLDPQKNYIFDGFPRTLKQAEMLNDLVSDSFLAVVFDIDKSILEERIVNRRSCPKCGAIFNLKLKPPQKEDTCDSCGHTGLSHRVDDTKEVLEKRFSVYEKESGAIFNYYKSKNKILILDASKDSEELVKEILKFS